MKKIIAVAVFLFAVMVIDVVADTSLLNLNRYAEYFGFQRGNVSPTSVYVSTAPRAEQRNFMNLGGHESRVDTPLEFALLSYYSPSVVQIRPVEADAILPANNPKLADLKLGAAVFKEIQILRFLNASGGSANTAAVGRHEGVLKFITDRGNVTRAEVEEFYRSGIRAFVNEIVDEQAARRQPTNPTTIAEMKQIITNFLLDPTRANFDILNQRINVYASTDGDRGRNASRTMVMALAEFNSDLSDAVINPMLLMVGRQE
jgi:hypothetical protein